MVRSESRRGGCARAQRAGLAGINVPAADYKTAAERRKRGGKKSRLRVGLAGRLGVPARQECQSGDDHDEAEQDPSRNQDGERPDDDRGDEQPASGLRLPNEDREEKFKCHDRVGPEIQNVRMSMQESQVDKSGVGSGDQPPHGFASPPGGIVIIRTCLSAQFGESHQRIQCSKVDLNQAARDGGEPGRGGCGCSFAIAMN